jgi:hypothetical protein
VRLLVPARCPDDQPGGGLLGATGGDSVTARSICAGRYGGARPRFQMEGDGFAHLALGVFDGVAEVVPST